VQRERELHSWLKIALHTFPIILFVATTFGGLLFLIALIVGAVYDTLSWEYALPPVIVVFLAIANLLALRLFDYKTLYNHLHSTSRYGGWWQALPNLSLELLPYSDKVILSVLYIATIPLELVYWAYVAIKWPVIGMASGFSSLRRSYASRKVHDTSRSLELANMARFRTRTDQNVLQR
jgi:hypothetical protein